MCAGRSRWVSSVAVDRVSVDDDAGVACATVAEIAAACPDSRTAHWMELLRAMNDDEQQRAAESRGAAV